MKKLFYILSLLCLTQISCKKQNVSTVSDKPIEFAHQIYFNIVDKNGNNIIHSANDLLEVDYVQNGQNQSHRLNLYKVQKSAQDTMPVANYNGFLVSDEIFGGQGVAGSYIGSASGGAGPQTPGLVHNFNFYLNGKSIGTVYFDYWTSEQNLVNNITNTAFTLNNTPATHQNLTGFIAAGYPSLSQVNNFQGWLDTLNEVAPTTGIYLFVLQYN